HPQYIACCLRLADIMDFDRSRTPLTLLRTITDETSQREWEKHLSITGWTIDEHDVEFHAKCRHPEHYVAVLDFLDAVDRELLECRRLVVRDATQQTKGYSLQLPTAVDRIYVKMADESYIAGGFRFELEYERIMKLLMDKSLYPDPSLFLRELLQNSLDACRLRKALEEEEGTGDLYTPHIVVWDNSADETSPSIVFQDNGVGMSEDVVKNYFMRVGRSYYRSGEFNAQRQRLAARKIALEATSQFGIGFLSCFMVADHVEIETYRIGEDPLHIEIEGATKYFVIRRLAKPAPAQIGAIPAEPENDGPPKYAGTRITVHLREAKPLNVKQVIDQFAVNVEFPVLTIEGEAKHVTSAWRWMTEPITFDEMATESDVNREGLESILTLVDRRLDEYDFCDGLIGGIWFWLLRTADGKGVPRHGHLRIGQELSPAGVPGILSGLRPPERDAIRASDLAEIEPAPGISPEVVTLWNTSTRDERREMLGFLARPVQFAPWWSSSTEAMLLIHGGGDGWKSMAHQLTIPALIAGSESLAQHGIVLPAGITDWQPMQGTSERLRLIRFAGGFRVDDRRADAPEPAASRLYVDASGGARVAVPVGRALLRFAIDLFRQHQDERWLEQFCDSANAPEYWDVIAFLEAPLVREHIRHLVVHNDATDERWTEAQVRERWGNIVPIVTYNADDAGILSEAGVNRLVLGRKERFERDGQWFVDLDSELTQAATWPEMWRNE
ncbi:MAG TPA: ATP-binding protein, partial [Thermoanaerobaculia bacterium]|nr:ATP-binding protein [Thermoanaerobaculia bacterium]